MLGALIALALYVDIPFLPFRRAWPNTVVPSDRPARPEDGVLSRARITADTNAPCVLASERPARPDDEQHSARPSFSSAAG